MSTGYTNLDGSPDGPPSPPLPSSSPSLNDGAGTPAVLMREFPNIFARGTPKHTLQGLADGVQNIAVGVGLGVSGLVAMPVMLGKEEGAVGVAKGLGLGVASLVGLTVYGTATGIWQVARGVYNTKDAVVESVRGSRYWDSEQGKWVEVHLSDTLAELPVTDDDLFAQARQLYKERIGEGDTAAENENGAVGSTGEAGTNDYYAILGVSKTATAAEIRTAFHRKALVMHPDKNPDDEGATLRFQKLLEAHNVLSDEGRRLQYDTHGVVDSTLSQEKSYTDVEEGLGAPFLEVFIGRVTAAVLFTPNVIFTNKIRKELQRRRTLRLAQHLLRFLDEENGIEAARSVIQDAVSTRAGPKLMPIVAHQYAVAARQHLRENNFLKELDSFGTSKWESVSRVAGLTAVSGRAAYKAARKTISEEDTIDMIISVCEGDVQRTVLRACRLVLYDSSVSKEQRKQRAVNLRKLSDMIDNVCHERSTILIS
ncbi:uncharacterized protein TM35_000411470 [Trypanosoma theileri]|uniref:J domain-containing protein n=1 Tax=Trypanosoma theileri TaxID=67003 RepID=A0A1X0NJF9_9TRYP|nr:uncharacterized protein TM35_000411470 [Trypanosoma theileri]ORC84777.1 hypothetical protein TM35_000411470 [Trypanosoma theileri]